MTFAVARRTKAAKFESILTPGTDLKRFEGSFTIAMKFKTEFFKISPKRFLRYNIDESSQNIREFSMGKISLQPLSQVEIIPDTVNAIYNYGNRSLNVQIS